ncbi:unnamed protein product [Pleuronectes platessa]|uniref:Uncharacterized protein n=1 Tax=Pleuronectes platessa TaxID=8262 RepID=A0A9N7Y8T6_PLEPL|nr:unnamed protein product [Pleuronectes platessa]
MSEGTIKIQHAFAAPPMTEAVFSILLTHPTPTRRAPQSIHILQPALLSENTLLREEGGKKKRRRRKNWRQTRREGLVEGDEWEVETRVALEGNTGTFGTITRALGLISGTIGLTRESHLDHSATGTLGELLCCDIGGKY